MTDTRDYSSYSDEQLNVAVAKRLGLTFREYDAVEVFTDWGTWVYKSWATDANEALKLIEPDGFTIDYTHRGYEVKLDYGLARVGVDKEFGRAVCIAWLMWQDTKEETSQ